MAVPTWYVDTVGGNVDNGGSSPGDAKITGSGGSNGATWTSGNTTITLLGGHDLSAVVVGDVILLNNATGGVGTGGTRFEITAVDNGLDTVTVAYAPSNSQVNQSFKIGGALKTLDEAMNAVRSGDPRVWVKASGNYNEQVTIDIALTTPCVFEGYTSTIGDGGIVTIDGEATRANCLQDSLASQNANYVFKNFKFMGGTTAQVNCSVQRLTFKNCEFDGSDGSNSNVIGTVSYMFYKCYSHSSSGDGIGTTTGLAVVACKIFNNATHGVNATNGIVAFSEFFSNGSNAINFGGSNDTFAAALCNTIDGDGKDTNIGIAFAPSFTPIILSVNNIVYDCTTGMSSGSDEERRRISVGNLVNSNTADYSAFDTDEGEVTSAPQFSNEGTNDYRLATGSPAIDAGIDASAVEGVDSGRDIGAFEKEASSATGTFTGTFILSGGQL